jgi:hypothetical protein
MVIFRYGVGWGGLRSYGEDISMEFRPGGEEVLVADCFVDSLKVVLSFEKAPGGGSSRKKRSSSKWWMGGPSASLACGMW